VVPTRRLIAALALLAALLPAGAATADPTDGQRPLVYSTLQVSPELALVRPGVAVELTARISHTVPVEMPVRFEVHSIDPRVRFGQRLSPEALECVIAPLALSCSVTVNSQQQKGAFVRAWLTGPGAVPYDAKEGRLASLAEFFHPRADCRLEDGEPVDDKCRGGLNSHVEPGAAEPDSTDVVVVGWSGAADALVDCDDPGADGDTDVEVRPASERTVTYLCTVRNRVTGEPVVGANLAGEVMGGPFDDERHGPRRSDYGLHPYHEADRRLCITTAPQGHCRFDLTVPGSGPGQLPLCLWSDGDNDGVFGDHEVDGGGCHHEPVDEPESNDGTDAVLIDLRGSP
jgi:hypothetical protein